MCKLITLLSPDEHRRILSHLEATPKIRTVHYFDTLQRNLKKQDVCLQVSKEGGEEELYTLKLKKGEGYKKEVLLVEEINTYGFDLLSSGKIDSLPQLQKLLEKFGVSEKLESQGSVVINEVALQFNENEGTLWILNETLYPNQKMEKAFIISDPDSERGKRVFEKVLEDFNIEHKVPEQSRREIF